MGNTAYGTLLDGKEITKNHGKIVEKMEESFLLHSICCNNLQSKTSRGIERRF